MKIIFFKDDYENQEMHFTKKIIPVDVGMWIMNFLIEAKMGQIDMMDTDDGCCKYNGTIDLHMLGGHVLNKIKERLE